LGLSKDDGATFSPVLHFCGIRGPLGCANSSITTQQCAPIWAAQQDLLGCGDFGSDGGIGEGGGFQADGAPSTQSSSGSSAPLTGPSKSSCSCDVVTPSSGWATLGGAAA